ncbi:hypothetical protein D3C87_1592870 [compost metagenome]
MVVKSVGMAIKVRMPGGTPCASSSAGSAAALTCQATSRLTTATAISVAGSSPAKLNRTSHRPAAPMPIADQMNAAITSADISAIAPM